MAKKSSGYKAEVENLWHALKMKWSDKDIASTLSRVVEHIMDGEGCEPFVDTRDIMPTYAAGTGPRQIPCPGAGAQLVTMLRSHFTYTSHSRRNRAASALWRG